MLKEFCICVIQASTGMGLDRGFSWQGWFAIGMNRVLVLQGMYALYASSTDMYLCRDDSYSWLSRSGSLRCAVCVQDFSSQLHGQSRSLNNPLGTSLDTLILVSQKWGLSIILSGHTPVRTCAGLALQVRLSSLHCTC